MGDGGEMFTTANLARKPVATYPPVNVTALQLAIGAAQAIGGGVGGRLGMGDVLAWAEKFAAFIRDGEAA